jgi:hypothetical protein
MFGKLLADLLIISINVFSHEGMEKTKKIVKHILFMVVV